MLVEQPMASPFLLKLYLVAPLMTDPSPTNFINFSEKKEEKKETQRKKKKKFNKKLKFWDTGYMTFDIKAILICTFFPTKYSTPSQVVPLVKPFPKLSLEPL